MGKKFNIKQLSILFNNLGIKYAPNKEIKVLNHLTLDMIKENFYNLYYYSKKYSDGGSIVYFKKLIDTYSDILDYENPSIYYKYRSADINRTFRYGYGKLKQLVKPKELFDTTIGNRFLEKGSITDIALRNIYLTYKYLKFVPYSINIFKPIDRTYNSYICIASFEYRFNILGKEHSLFINFGSNDKNIQRINISFNNFFTTEVYDINLLYDTIIQCVFEECFCELLYKDNRLYTQILNTLYRKDFL